MSNRVGTFLKKTLLGKKGNLVSLEEPFDKMQHLLQGQEVTGILDAGASYGRISKRLMRRFPQAHVFAFEPNPLYAERLRQFAEAEPRFHPQFVALSDRKGHAALHVTESPGSTSLLTPGQHMRELYRDSVSVASCEQVEVTTIDDWVRSNDSPAVQLMKFDIQGAELQALRGATETLGTSTLLIYAEIWFNPGYEGGALYSEIDLFLRSQGFVLYDLFKPKYDPKGPLLWGNAIFLHADRTGL